MESSLVDGASASKRVARNVLPTLSIGALEKHSQRGLLHDPFVIDGDYRDKVRASRHIRWLAPVAHFVIRWEKDVEEIRIARGDGVWVVVVAHLRYFFSSFSGGKSVTVGTS